MSEIVERVALAIANARQGSSALRWNKPAPHHYEKARAAIAAMYPPIDGMIAAALAEEIWPDMPAGGNPEAISRAVYRTMIVRALSE